jgi:periplasmic protein TonB
MFEAYVTERAGGRRRGGTRRLVFMVSVALHGALLSGAVAHSFWQVDELSPPGVTVTFIQAMVAPPPPPPPPAAAVAEKVRPKPKKPRLEMPEIVQPAPTPEQPPEEKPAEVAEAPEAPEPELGAAEGQPGGVEGGVAGGVLGRIDPTPPPPPKPSPPISVAPSVGASYRLTDLEDPRYRPSLPSAINRPGMSVWGVFRICVAADGHVTEVTVIKSADALVDNDWVAKMKTWRYRPYSVDGRPVPFCHPARIVVNVKSGSN